MVANKLWLYDEVSCEQAESMAKKLGISILLAKIFLSRGIHDIHYIRDFLNPSLERLHDPFLMKDMDKAVERILKAVNDGEKILVYGDYDVDGTTSTAILTDFLRSQGASVDYYIPDRQEEGYGLSKGAVDKVIGTGVALIITVDCGITAVEEVQYVLANGMDIIITDHHQCKEELPEAYAVVNPCRPDCSYPFKQLAGVGVAYKLLTALCMRLGLGDISNRYMDIVTLGTVADVVPLVDENRIIVKHGIKKLECTGNPGLKALIHCAGFKDKPVSSYGISFGLAPRINAAGRVGDAGRAVKLFITRDEKEADQIADELNEENKLRQEMEMLIIQQAIEIIDNQLDIEKEKVIVVAGEGWHHGVIGIVASKITDRYYRPCILLSNEDGICKGSARSIEAFNLFNALSSCSDLLEKFGGHELAAGLAVRVENLVEFRRRINRYADGVMDAEDLIPKLKIDVRLDKNDISMDNIRELDVLAPFGAGNPGPLFAYNGCKIGDKKTVGDNKHLKLKLTDGGFFAEAIGFNLGQKADELNGSDLFDIACSLEINVWNSVEKIQFNLKDIKPNRRIQMEKEYYSTLHQCIKMDSLEWNKEMDALWNRIETVNNENELRETLADAMKREENISILVNSLKSLENFESILNISNGEGKIPYKICYTCLDEKDSKKIQVIVNPAIGEGFCKGFDKVIVYGTWVDLIYLRDIVNCIDMSKIFLYNIEVYNFAENDIITDRTDLAAIYQYIKKNYKNTIMFENMHAVGAEIAESYKLKMNYFKFRQGIEIFEELNLLKKEYYGLYGVSVTMADNIKTKTNLEKSVRYKKLQVLKGQRKGG